MSGGLIDSTEMYVRTVLELNEEGIPALRARLAERLGLSAPSVSEGVARLQKDGLLELADDRTVRLTTKGGQLARAVMRKHRLAERLLVDVLGLEPEHVHEEACRWEHVISDRVESKLVEFLGDPATSPYGNPIPGHDEDPSQLVTLADATADRVRVRRISEQLQSSTDLIHDLMEAGILSGGEVGVKRDDRGLVLCVDGQAIPVDDDSARLLYVSEA